MKNSIRVLNRLSAKDGSVRYLFGLYDDVVIEAVSFRGDRYDSICVSTQAGCAFACGFCATGISGLVRNLSAAEIVDQVRLIFADIGKPTAFFDVVFKGMGEPLHNLNSVLSARSALKKMYPTLGFTLSTVGLPHSIRKLTAKAPDVMLQVSLHAATDAVRATLMPAAKKYAISAILDAAEEHAQATGNAFQTNYVLLQGVNDTDSQLEALIGLLKGRSVFLKLASYNSIPEAPFTASSETRRRIFEDACRSARIRVVRFNSLAIEIEGGCGQLRARRRVQLEQSGASFLIAG